MYHVYVLYSEKRGSFYIGQTQNLEARVKAHNEGKSKWTKGKGPCTLVFSEKHQTRSQAMIREKFLKTGVGREWLHGHLGF